MQSVASGAILLIVVAFVLYRRMRPQPVRPRRAMVLTGIIVVVSVFSLAGTNRLTAHPLAVILAVPALLVGFGGGLLLMRSIHFWRDRATGALWMRGGVVYIAVWLATVLVRQWAAAAAGTTSQQNANPAFAILSADLIVVSIGLWIARAVAVVRKYREAAPADAIAR